MTFDGTYLLLTLLGAAVGVAFTTLLLTVTDDTEKREAQMYLQGRGDGIRIGREATQSHYEKMRHRNRKK